MFRAWSTYQTFSAIGIVDQLLLRPSVPAIKLSALNQARHRLCYEEERPGPLESTQFHQVGVLSSGPVKILGRFCTVPPRGSTCIQPNFEMS